MDVNSTYAVMDMNGMIIEQSNDFNKGICGYTNDIIQKSRELLNSYDRMNSVEIFFENSVIVIKDNCSTNLNITTVVDNK